MLPQRLIDLVVYTMVRSLIAVVQALPLELCAAWAGGLATLFTRVLKVRQQVIDDNLRHAFGHLTAKERDAMAWQMWRHLFLMTAEVAQTPRKIHRTNWKEHSQIRQVEKFVRTLTSGRPLVMISAHFGNFELGGYLMGLFGFPSYTVARRLDNPYLDRFINDFRGRTGQFMLPKEGSGDQIADLLKRGGILTLLGDQAAGDKGCWVDFFGRPASTHKAVAVFSLGSGAPTMIGTARRLGRPLQYEVGPHAIFDPLDPDFDLGTIPLFSQKYADCLEQVVRQSPEQYWWLHRRWKGNPPRRVVERIAKRRRLAA